MTDQSNTPTPPINRRPIIDAVRSLFGRVFKQAEADAADDAFDPGFGLETRAEGAAADRAIFSSLDRVTGGPSVPVVRRNERKKKGNPRAIGEAGIELIKRFEGCARLRRDGQVEAYPDPGTGGDPWTIGWGATGYDDQAGTTFGDRIGPATVWTQAQCDARLDRDLKRYAADVAKTIGAAPTSQSQFDALVSFHYNTGAIARATLTKKHIAGDYDAAAAEFARWNKAGGRVLKGLVRRRAEEAKLYAG